MEFGLDMAFKFECFFPAIPGGTEMMMLQGMTYKATLTLAEDVDPHDLEVEAWTSQCDKDNPAGDWHAIRLPYIDAKQCGVKHEYGVTEVITSDKNFNFTFRAKCTGPGYGNRDWVWSHPFGVNGFAPVLPCRAEDKWTQEPNYNHICGALHLGNFIAATHAKECGFTHVINVAETLDVVFPNKDVIYHKVFIKDGAHNPIEEEKLLDAVHWIKQHDVSGNKLLLNCRAGIGRAGSVAVAYVYYINPEEMSYDDAYNYCFNKRFVYPHSRLRERIEQVFPRTLKFVHFTPEIPSWNYMFMLEAMTYKTALRIPCHLNTDAQRLEVFAWTNQVDRHQSNGQWHRLKLTYIERDEVDRDLHLYGRSEIITGNRDFNFTFCVQPPGAELQWSHRLGEDGFAHVEPPRQYDNWTLGPDYTHILGSIHVGNFIAATNAEECGITHVLNVADNLDMVYPSGKVTYQKIPMSDGAHNPVSLEKIRDAVEWLRLQNKEGNKVLVNCRAGIGRAGSVGVAFVFAYETSWSYEDAYQHVFSKRFVYPHAGLKDILYTLYPRTH